MGLPSRLSNQTNTMKLLLVLVALVAPSLGARLPYIVGGQDVKEPGKWPWQASIQYYGSHICGNGDGYTLAGVTSFGLVTCSTSYPSVYTRISYYRDWITQNSGV